MTDKECDHVPCVITDNSNRPFEVICQDCLMPMTKEDYLKYFGRLAITNIRWGEEADPEDITYFSDSDGFESGWKNVVTT